VSLAAGAGRAAGDRAERQRERILRAARSCFVRHGFHAAAMADIASAAEMSPGLIYRYFPSKEAIVRAIVGRQMAEARRTLDDLGSADDLAEAIVEAFERWCAPDDGETVNAALFLEMVAVAARDPVVAETLRAADDEIRQALEMAVRRGLGPGQEEGPESVGCRVAILQCLLEGLLVRAVRQPDLDRRLLRRWLVSVLGASRSADLPAARAVSPAAPSRPSAAARRRRAPR
jgi:AcrR family transcriptional regulator